jgi:hypothetical protein
MNKYELKGRLEVLAGDLVPIQIKVLLEEEEPTEEEGKRDPADGPRPCRIADPADRAPSGQGLAEYADPRRPYRPVAGSGAAEGCATHGVTSQAWRDRPSLTAPRRYRPARRCSLYKSRRE